jgi:hypothetical protein
MTNPLADATAGAIGACIANTIVFPLDVVKTKLQVQTKVLDKEQFQSTTDAILKIVKKDGIAGLYAGLGSGLTGTLISSFSYYFIYSSLRIRYHKSIEFKQISTAMELTLGAVAGALCQFIVLPIGIVTTRQQTVAKNKSVVECVEEIVREEGITELWKGLNASLVLCVNPAITFGVFERIKSQIIEGKTLTSKQAFLIGALSKALATVVTCNVK